jgi:dipeptidyl aminopeptidase/acylaminoacyl peptidase
MRTLVMAAMVLTNSTLMAKDAGSVDAAAAFGARPSVANLTLSPDGKSVAYVAPGVGPGSTLFTLRLEKDAKFRRALAVDGKPVHLGECRWVSNDRLACSVYGVVKDPKYLLPFTRLMAINADGSNVQMLSTQINFYTRGYMLGGGEIIDWLPDQDGAVLMSRGYLPDDHVGTHIASTKEGLGVDYVDTRTLKIKAVESPKEGAFEYLTDGRGTVRVMGLRAGRNSGIGQDTGVFRFLYRSSESAQWRKLGEYNSVDRTGFEPYAVDAERNIAYGGKKKDGRMAIYSVTLDDSLHEELIYARPDVDVVDLIRIGRRRRVVGVSYSTDVRKAVFFDPDLDKLTTSLSKALPNNPAVRIVDSSVDETVLLVHASRDDNPGSYFLFDRPSRQLRPLFEVREELSGVKLATVTPITYPAKDGTQVPGYITFPPGKENTKGLPAIVMPHGGPGARNEWAFDWLAQFYAASGFVVLQPNFRGSSGYGDAWYHDNGFRSWPIAIGDVLDAGRWLVAQGIADPSKLGIVGWSYGGYAALQSAVTDPGVFKAVVAIAPVTDLDDLREEWRGWSNHELESNYIGDGVREASPAENANKIKVPVLLFHGKLDRNVAVGESEHMARSLTSAGVPHQLVTWDDLDHQLEDSNARAEMLRKSEAFLRQSLGMSSSDARPPQ